LLSVGCPQGEASWELKGVSHYFPSCSSKLRLHFLTAKSCPGLHAFNECNLIVERKSNKDSERTRKREREKASVLERKEQRWGNLPVSN